MADLLKAQDIKEWLKKLPEWELDKKQIERTFEFDDFSQAVEFVNGVAEIAEEEDHHPDIDLRYNKVRIALSTHSEGGLTEMDFEVAEKNGTLIRYDIIQGLKRLYDLVKDETVKEKAMELIGTETDDKYCRKYASVWRVKRSSTG